MSLIKVHDSIAMAAQARGQWGDDYDGGGPGWGYYYGGSGNDDDGFGSGFGSGIGIDYAAATRYRTAHGALAALAFVGLFPIGAIVMRMVPGRLTWLVHGIFQLVAYAVFISAAALGIYLVRMVRIPPDGRSLVSYEPRMSFALSWSRLTRACSFQFQWQMPIR